VAHRLIFVNAHPADTVPTGDLHARHLLYFPLLLMVDVYFIIDP